LKRREIRGSFVDISICFPADARELHGVRSTLAGWLAGLEVTSPVADELILIVSELATNAIEASNSSASEVRVTAWFEGAVIALEVDDDGAGFCEGTLTTGPNGMAAGPLPPPSSVRGRGLPIVGAFVDRLDVRRHGARTIVHVERRITAGEPEPESERWE